MKQFSLFLLLFIAVTTHAQQISDFEGILTEAGTVWDGSDGSANGFSGEGAWFPTIWATSEYGDYWGGGFAVSSVTDNTTSGLGNQYSAVTGAGFYGSLSYAVAQAYTPYFKLTGPARTIIGAYITNTTYAHNSMRDGDAFAKKFGGNDGSDPDYFRVNFVGFNNGTQSGDTVTFYLADFRSSEPAEDHIIDEWTWLDLSALGSVDSVTYFFESSDVGDWGINTPSYFAIDNLTIEEPAAIHAASTAGVFNLYPNPAADRVNIRFNAVKDATVEVLSASGQRLRSFPGQASDSSFQVYDLPAGFYLVRVVSGASVHTQPFVITR